MDNATTQFIITLLQTVFLELLIIFGIFFLLGYILSSLQKATHAHYTRSIGWPGILITAWIGTPIHELGHVFFAKIFRHKIHKISLFSPNPATGGLGHVEHSYKATSLYQRIGNFFVGAAPLIWGAVILLLFLYLLVPNAAEVFAPLLSTTQHATDMIAAMGSSFSTLFTIENTQRWQFWLFLYLAFCVTAHMAPSKQDRKNMYSGLVALVVMLIILNAIPVFLQMDVLILAQRISQSMTVILSLFFLALLLSLVHYIVSYILFIIPKRIIQAITRS